jgi:hypothetical protein
MLSICRYIFVYKFTRWPYYITMSIIFSTVLTDQQILVLKRHTHKFSPGSYHLLTLSQNKVDYGRVQVIFRGVPKNVCAHRLAYVLAIDCSPLSVKCHVSHQSHNKLSVNVSHLSPWNVTMDTLYAICIFVTHVSMKPGYKIIILVNTLNWYKSLL